MRIDKKKLAISIATPLVVGGASALLTRTGMKEFQGVQQPPLSPPQWLFPIVWTILYVMMGIASYLIADSDGNKEEIQEALFIYGLQLGVNFLWSIFFFNQQWYLLSLIWLVLLWILILKNTRLFYGISQKAGYLMVPYLLWVTFAGYLNFGVYLLNR